MKRKLLQNLYNLTMSVGMLAYALSLIFMRTEVRIAEPPLRVVLIVLCFVFPVLSLLGIIREKKTWQQFGVILMGAAWFVIAYLYWINPIYTAGHVLAITIGVMTLVSLYRGDYRHV